MNNLPTITNKNTFCVIITYNPASSFIDNVRLISSMFNRIFVVDNGSSENCELLDYIPSELVNVTIIKEKCNWGIAKALNIGIKSALLYHPCWIITFDQDSIPNSQFVKAYNEALSIVNSPRLGLLSCCFAEGDSKFYSPVRVKRKHTIITSGCLHNVEIFDSVGFYNEDLFIDCVDFDYSLRVSKNGYETYRISQQLLKHHLGNPVKRRFLCWNIYSSNHSLLRRYYMSRNHFYLSKKYFSSYPFYIIKKNIFFLVSILQLLYVEDNKKEKLRMIWNGYRDFLKM